METPLSSKRTEVAVFLISAVLIAYQILLVKLFTIQYWYHFAYLIISIALLGFGASGTFIFFFKNRLKEQFSRVLFICPLLFVLSIWGNVYYARLSGFNPLMIIWQMSEIIKLLCLSLCLFAPFFFGALCIGLSFFAKTGHPYKIYFANLIGSGLGSLLPLLSFFHIWPYDILFIISLVAIGASLAASHTPLRKVIIGLITFMLIAAHYFFLHVMPLPMSPFKDLAQSKNLIETKMEKEIFGPLGLVTVLDSPAYHYLPDISLNCPYPIPRQKGLFHDGNTVGAINQFSGRLEDIAFMDWRTTSLAYHLLNQPIVLIIGAGTGTEILNARYHKAHFISIVEINTDISRLMEESYRQFSGAIYNQKNDAVFAEDGREYLERTSRRFNLIQISLLESMSSASSGVYSLNENYLFTREALALCLNRLKPEGILSISRWIKNPPRDNIKLLAMAIEAIEARGKNSPPQSLIMIRSWQTATLLIKNGSFNRQEVDTVRSFCQSRSFDVCYYPGVKEEETNIYNRLDSSYFYLAAIKLLSSERALLYKTYPFYIRPATDDRPFFSYFFKMDLLKMYLGSQGRQWTAYMDWGYLLVWMTFTILFLLGMVLILAPLPALRVFSGKLTATVIYFGSLGLAYMLLEISILQQFIRYLYDPIFSATVVIGSFLFFSGIGSLIAGNIKFAQATKIAWAAFLIAIMGITILMADHWLQPFLVGKNLWIRMVSCGFVIAPLAIPMGFLFPTGISQLEKYNEGLIPWAWGVNGFFSVVGASAAVLIAIHCGFKSVILFSLGLYGLAVVAFPWLRESKDKMPL
jgi:spermidine synthase